MRVIVDADACPVKGIIENVAKAKKVEVFLFSDFCHNILSEYAQVVTLDKYSQSVDMAIVNFVEPKDIVVTQDYGLAALVLGKGAYAIGNSGMVYTNDNIDGLLMQRYTSHQLRNAGVRVHHQHKRNREDDLIFAQNFKRLLEIGE